MAKTLPDAVVKAMCKCNPDGMGLVTPSVSYRGMNVRTLLDRLHERDINEPCIMHFRLATHGSVRRSNCHPFYDKQSDVWFAHNGILPVQPFKGKTDSETAFRRLFVPLIREYGIDSDELAYTVNQIIGGNKLAFLDGNGEVRLFGEYYEWHGSLFSNLRFRYFLR